MKAKELKEKLENKTKSAWENSTVEKKELEKFAKEYIDFLSRNKTEREAVSAIREIALANGYTQEVGSKFFVENHGKNIALVSIGENDISKGVKLIVSHIDSPRLDLKQNPLYEDTELAFLKTHYYGGIKKYQWVTRPLALHGVVITKNGQKLEISIGEKDDEPIFMILDLLPHLSHKKQDDKKIGEAICGEKLNVLIGSIPYETSEELKDKVKLNILNILYKKYKIIEKDFQSAELEVVPAGKAREVGFDRSIIAGYGQDDRVCAFTSLKALLDAKPDKNTYVVLFSDKEEIGSDGNTGAKSLFLKQIIKQILVNKKVKPDMITIEECLFNSQAVSADVNGAVDPDWKEVHEERNAAKMGHGVCMTKFTGARGKSGASDANAEYIGKLRNILDDAQVSWQTGELGKVDEGGGGTIAKYLAYYGMDVVDMGPAILSMHAPVEVASKIDVYMTYKAYKAFLEKA